MTYPFLKPSTLHFYVTCIIVVHDRSCFLYVGSAYYIIRYWHTNIKHNLGCGDTGDQSFICGTLVDCSSSECAGLA